MIHRLTGTVQQAYDHTVIVALGPIECALQVPDITSFEVGQSASIHVHMHWNQEQGPSFFGFASMLEMQVFVLASL